MERMRFIGEHGRETASLDVGPMRETLNGRFTSLARSDLSAALLGACAGIPAHYGVSVSAIEDAGGAAVRDALGWADRTIRSRGRIRRAALARARHGIRSRRAIRDLSWLLCRCLSSDGSARDELTNVMYSVSNRQVARSACAITKLSSCHLPVRACRRQSISWGEQKDALRRAFVDMGWEVPEILDRMDDAGEVRLRSRQPDPPPALVVRPSGARRRRGGMPVVARRRRERAWAMTEAYVLAGELHRANGDYARAFAAYEARLHSFVMGEAEGGVGLPRIFRARVGVSLKVRNAAVHALAFPYLTKVLVARSFRDDLTLPHYLAA